MKDNTRLTGNLAEEMAYTYLHKQGLKLLEKNYRTNRGEIDLIMRDGEVTVFIEVRSRKDNIAMDVIETIDAGKCTHIIRTSQHYLQNNNRTNKDICRFDLVLLTGALECAEIEWIKNAFEA